MGRSVNPNTGQPLTVERIRFLFSYDPTTGNFFRLVPSGRTTVGPVKKTLCSHGYLKISVDGKSYFAHRLAWFYMHGYWTVEMDHIDGNSVNNRINNLRPATQQENSQNLSINGKSKSGLRGVFPGKNGRWQAKITVNYKGISLGTFDTKEEAHQAYLNGKRRFHTFNPEFTR